jgi:hypothetical protein
VPRPDRGVHKDDDQAKPVTPGIDLQSLPDRTNYPATVALSMPASQIEVRITISSYQRVAL